MDLKEQNYPANCPPPSAKPVNGVYYRLCYNRVVSPKDFLTHVELGKPFPPDKLCEACALSFFRSLKKISSYQRRHPKRFEKMVIIQFHITEEWGIGEEKGGHLNLWQAKSDNYIDLCRGYKEVKSNE